MKEVRTLMPDQVVDAQLMADGGDLPNYSKAGTGKTLSTLEAFKLAGHQRGLVLCPQIALQMWEEEIKDWVGASVKVLRKGSDLPNGEDFIVTTFDLAGRSLRRDLYSEFSDGALILDEAHALRRRDSKRTIAVFGEKSDGVGGFMEQFDQVWSLTGTPIMRHHDDLWSQLRPLFPWVLDHYWSLEFEDFVRNFCAVKMKKFHARMAPKLSVIRSQNEPIINKILYKDIGAIRRIAASGLPELAIKEYSPKLGVITSEYARLVNKMTEQDLLKALIAEDEDEEHSMQHIWQAVTLAKVKSVSEYLEALATDSPILVGVWHNSVGESYMQELQKMGLRVARVYGATPQGKREEIRNMFNAGELDALVGQMQAMGVSWNLQVMSNRVVIAQDHYSPGVIEQFYKRVYRKGQKRTTFVDIMTSDHPLDRAIKKMRLARARSQAISLDK